MNHSPYQELVLAYPVAAPQQASAGTIQQPTQPFHTMGDAEQIEHMMDKSGFDRIRATQVVTRKRPKEPQLG